jgi:hypothetical protein
MSIMEYTNDDKNRLKKNIEKLEYNQLCQIYNIIIKDTDKVSENNNGIFINLKYLNNNTLEKLFDFVEYCEKNKPKISKDTQSEKSIFSNEGNTNNTLFENSSKSFDTISKSIDITSKSSDTNDKPLDINSKSSDTITEEYNMYNLNLSTNNKGSDFIFKNYIDKLSSSNYKEFTEDIGKKTIKPNTNKIKLNGVKYRLIKKCREINKLSNSEIVETIINNYDNNEIDYKYYSLNELKEEILIK